MPESRAWRHVQAKLASRVRCHPEDQQSIDDLRRELRTAQLADHIVKVVNAHPRPTPEQCEQLRRLISPLKDETRCGGGHAV